MPCLQVFQVTGERVARELKVYSISLTKTMAGAPQSVRIFLISKVLSCLQRGVDVGDTSATRWIILEWQSVRRCSGASRPRLGDA